MNPAPPKRPRRTHSPSPSAQSQSSRADTALRAEPTISPSKPILPVPIPSSHALAGPSLPLRPQSWAPGWTSSSSTGSGPSYSTEKDRERGYATAGPSRIRSRRSFEGDSHSSPGTPKMEGIDEGQEMGTPQALLSRDTTSRAPRSIMACVRCRKQKMKCDGPGRIPCNGCRAAGLPCIFEPRTRPKSMSTMPTSNHPPFFSTRPATPNSVGLGGFYPPQPLPPTLSRMPPGSGEYMRPRELRDLRDPREPMPPPPAASINVLTSPFPPPPRAGSPGSSTYLPHPRPHPHTVLAPPYAITTSAPLRPPTPSAEGRLRNVEFAVRHLSSVPATLSALHSTVDSLHRSLDSLAAAVAPNAASRTPLEISETVWEDYRSRAWPLTPWLIGLRERQGLQGRVADFLGKRVVMDRSEVANLASQEADKDVRSELARLSSRPTSWTRNEIRAAGFFGSWTNDPFIVAMAVAQGRLSGLSRIWGYRKSHDDWREWIYLSIMDRMSQLVDFEPSFIPDVLAAPWRDRLATAPAGSGESAARDRDRDLKLLAWVEYGETLAEVHHAQDLLGHSPENYEDTPGSDRRVTESHIEIWRKYAPRWEAWAGAWSVRSDPVLSLHFNYATLYTTSPGYLAHESIWHELAKDVEGCSILDRARDAAFAVIQAICSPEIGRTLTYSFPLFRPMLALALHLILTLTTLPPTSASLVSMSHITATVRSTSQTLTNSRSPDMSPGRGLLGEIAETGDMSLVAGSGSWEMGRDTWRRLVG